MPEPIIIKEFKTSTKHNNKIINEEQPNNDKNAITLEEFLEQINNMKPKQVSIKIDGVPN